MFKNKFTNLSKRLLISQTNPNDNYFKLLSDSLKNPEKFWSKQAHERLKFSKKFTQTCDINFEQAKFSWFGDGELNVKENCVDRYVGNTNPALIYEGDEPGREVRISYRELQAMVHRIAFKLKGLGVGKGDKVAMVWDVWPISTKELVENIDFPKLPHTPSPSTCPPTPNPSPPCWPALK